MPYRLSVMQHIQDGLFAFGVAPECLDAALADNEDRLDRVSLMHEDGTFRPFLVCRPLCKLFLGRGGKASEETDLVHAGAQVLAVGTAFDRAAAA